MALEKFRLLFQKEKEGFEVGSKMVSDVVGAVMYDGLYGSDEIVARVLLDFEVTSEDHTLVKSENGVQIYNKDRRQIFSVGIGETALTYLVKPKGDAWIYKSRPLSEINSLEELTATIYGFLAEKPQDSELIDVSQENLLKRMNAGRGERADISKFTKIK